MDAENGARCPLSQLAHPHTLSHRYGADYCRFGCFTCGVKEVDLKNDGLQYYCSICDIEFHENCHKRPRKITHPYHLQHSLTLTFRNPNTGILSIPESGSVEFIFDKCNWCGKDLKGDCFYRCLICSFCLDLSCAETIPPLTISNPKSHHHSLLFLPRPLLLPCDACGLINQMEPSYVCFQCNYMVHKTCMDLPRVIKITRHQHRLSHTPYLSPVISSCRICYKKVDIKYGQYSCNPEDCSYVAHSKCATHVNVWDGKELEWEETQESDETQDVSPFRNLPDGYIKHFSHKHRLKLKNQNGDTEKQCRACVCPILSHQLIYHCEKCDFSLHEVCAGLPRKLDHALHNHTLFLDPSPLKHYESMYCSSCFRASTGFRYRCSEKDCQSGELFLLDVRCILVPECFTHQSHHEHPVFISTSYSSNDEILCKGCKKRCSGSHLQCTVCEFALCYTCGTTPNEIHYRFDKHPLTLSYGETTKERYWCEVCEKQLDPREWFYTCEECCITIHLQCIFGSSVFMKPGSLFNHRGGIVKVLSNSGNSREFCYICNNRCSDSIYYEGYKWWKTWIYYNNH